MPVQYPDGRYHDLKRNVITTVLVRIRGRAVRDVCSALGVSHNHLRVVFAQDYYDRKIMSWIASTKSINSTLVVDRTMQAVDYRFVAGKLRLSNGSGIAALLILGQAPVTLSNLFGLKPITRPIATPQNNDMAESFVKTFKRDYPHLAERTRDSQVVMRS